MKPKIDAQRWSEVRAAFDELVELDDVSRRERLSTLGASDPDLQRQVEALLLADRQLTPQLNQLDEIFSAGDSRDHELEQGADPLQLSGRTVSHFRIDEPLAAGGMGVVYRAHDTALHRNIALKFPLPPRHFDKSAKERFLHEARSAAALDHPNICSIHEVGETDDGQLFLAMPLYDGETLKQRLAREGPLAIAEAVSIARQITEGVRAAHGAGIVHRDLKPANVMLLRDGTVKVLDFGLAKVRDLTLTVSHARVGTVAYMAPEQIAGQPVDHRTDLWALGVIVYEMVTGRRPFQGEYDVAVAHAIVHTEPPRAVASRPGIGSALDALIARLLSKDPAARPASAAAVAAELSTIARMLEASAVAPLQPSTPGVRRKPAQLATAVAAVLVLAVMLTGAWLWSRRARAMADPPRTIAVLPFTDASQDPNQNEFTFGLSDAVGVELSRLQSLIVSGYVSVAGYRGTTRPLSQVADELAVSTVVTGRVQRLRELIAIDVEVVTPPSDKRLLARRYERPASQLLDAQLAIQNDIVEALDIELTPEERALLSRRPTSSAEAYELYLRGREAELRLGPTVPLNEQLESIRVAQSFYARARDVDPDFALARARLALTYAFNARYPGHSPARQDQAKLEAESALRIQPGLPEAHEALAWLYGPGKRDFAKSAEHMLLAIRGFPNNSEYRLSLADIYRRQGQWEEAIMQLERAMELEPRNPETAVSAAMTYSRVRRYEQAARAWDRALALSPDVALWKIIRGAVYMRWQGTPDTMAATLRTIPPGEDPNGMVTYTRVQVARIQKRYDDALAALNASQHVISFDGLIYYPRALMRAEVYEALGKTQQARSDYEAARALLVDSLKVWPKDTRIRIALGVAYAGLGRKQEAIAEAKRAMELLPLTADNPGATALMGGAAIVFAKAGDTSAALELIELLLSMPAGREVSVPLLRLDPAYDPLRSDPRFEQLLQRFSSQ